jgi:hypothetical protein
MKRVTHELAKYNLDLVAVQEALSQQMILHFSNGNRNANQAFLYIWESDQQFTLSSKLLYM